MSLVTFFALSGAHIRGMGFMTLSALRDLAVDAMTGAAI